MFEFLKCRQWEFYIPCFLYRILSSHFKGWDPTPLPQAAQSAGAVEYTDCRGVRLAHISILYMILNHLNTRLQPWKFRECRVLLHCYCFWRQHPTRHQLYGLLPPITKTIQVRWTRHAGHCWRSRDELISDVLLWTPTYGQAKAGWLARTYIQQLCEDTGCSPEDLPEAMNDREKWWKRVRDIYAGDTTWWYIYV